MASEALSAEVSLEVLDETEEIESLNQLLAKEQAQDPNLSRRFDFNYFLTFPDHEAEKKYKRFLSNEEALRVNFTFSCIFTFVIFIWGVRDFLQYEYWYRKDRFWLLILLRMYMIILGVGISGLLGWVHFSNKSVGTALKKWIIQNQHFLYFLVISCGSFTFSLFFFTYYIDQGLPISPHAGFLFALFVTVRMRWIFLLIVGILEIIFMGVCATFAGYPTETIIDVAIYLLVFSIIGLAGVVAMERNSRIVFSQQEMSLVLLHRNARTLKILAKQAQSANESKSRFVANMSHEIRTPLHGVITALDLLKSSGNLSLEQADYVEVAENSSGLLLDILNNVLAISKLQAEKVELECVPLDLRQIVESVATVFCQIAARKGVEVAAYIPPTCPVRLLSDSIRLKQILFNLVSNAVKFTPQGSVQVRVSVEEETENDVSLKITVQDTGIGVAKDSLHLMFQRFSQVDQSSTRRFQGTGLGLALVFEFTKLFGGSISVHSDGLDHGTHFIFSARFKKDNSQPLQPETQQPLLFNSQAATSGFGFSSSLVPHSPSLLSIFPISQKWVSLVFHSSPSIGQMCSDYFGHYNFDSFSFSFSKNKTSNQNQNQNQNPISMFSSRSSDPKKPEIQFSSLAEFSEFFGTEFVSRISKNGQISNCAPCVLVIDHKLAGDAGTQEMIQSISRISRELSEGVNRNKWPMGICPLFVLILDDPSQPGETDFPFLARSENFHVWNIKKPFGLAKIFGVIQTMHSFLLSEFDKAHKKHLLSIRRASAPALNVFKFEKQRKKLNQNSTNNHAAFYLQKKRFSVSFSVPVIQDSTKPRRPSLLVENRRRRRSQEETIFNSGLENLELFDFSTFGQEPETVATQQNRQPILTARGGAAEDDLYPSFQDLSNFKFGGSTTEPENNENESWQEEEENQTPKDENTTEEFEFNQQQHQKPKLPPRAKKSSVSFSTHGSISFPPLISSYSMQMPESKLLQSLVSGGSNFEGPPKNSDASASKRHGAVIGYQPSSAILMRSGAPAAPQGGEAESGGGQMIDPKNRILVADDNTINRKLTERLLTKAGFHCTSVENGLEAVEAASAQQFSVIFLDITMPIMDGCTAATLIREHQDKRDGPKAILCALSAADGEKFQNAPFDEVLSKPIKSADLIEAAQRMSNSFASQSY